MYTSPVKPRKCPKSYYVLALLTGQSVENERQKEVEIVTAVLKLTATIENKIEYCPPSIPLAVSNKHRSK